MMDADGRAITERLDGIEREYREQLAHARHESNRKQMIIADQARRLELAEGGLFRDLQQPVVSSLAAIIDRLDGYRGPDQDLAVSIRDELLETLALHDIHPVETTGAFDPARHRAVATAVGGGSAGTIVEVWRRGYARGDDVFRHASVVVGDETPRD